MRSKTSLPLPGFPRRELFRLISMLMLLVIVGMLMVRTRDASMWRWASSVPDDESATASTSSTSETSKNNGDGFVETLVTGPNDGQPFEQSQAEYQFQAITDKAPNNQIGRAHV